MTEFIMAHQIGSTLVAYYLFLSLVNALPVPDSTVVKPNSSVVYKFVFDLTHGLSANIMRISSLRNFVESNGKVV